MARILKRPMFSRGGTTKKNNGIMTGLVDRTEKNQGGRIGYAKGKTQAEIYADEYYNQLSKIQPPKSKLNLGEVGLNLAAGKYSGGDLISTLAGAGSDLYKDFTTKDDKRRNLDYNTRITAAKMGISKADAEKIAKAKALASKKKGFRILTEPEKASIPGLDISKTYQVDLDTNKIVQVPGSTGEAKTKLMKELEAAGILPGTEEYENAIKSFIFKESKTTAERNAEALGLIPGTKEYNQYIKDATYITNAAMERDIQSGGMVIGKAARDKIVSNQSFVKTVRTNLDEVNDLLSKDQSLGGASGFIRKIANKLGTAAEGFGVDVKAFMPKGLEDKVFDTEIARLSALEALLAPAYARVLFPNQRMTNFLVQEAQDKMNLTGLSGTEEVLARLGEITNQFDIYIEKNEVLLGNQPVYKDDIKKFKAVVGEDGKVKLVEIKQ
jgi:hypothetical protein